jgi:hypothetical protein
MKTLSVLCVALCIGLSTTAAPARGGGMGSHISVTGGAFGISAAAPGTNSLGTALSSSGIGHGSMSGMEPHMSITGGAFGTSAAAPGTNSLGTALSSSGIGDGPMKGSLIGTSPAIDREEAKVDKMINSICRGC